VAAVGVIKRNIHWILLYLALYLLLYTSGLLAAVLPAERGDGMYHRYDGGGVTVDGPAVLVRKNFKETVSVNAAYYVDNVSSASIDVTATGAGDDAAEATFYTLQSGDTLGKIAAQHYGDAGKYPVIFEANQPMLPHPDKIYPGQSLPIPPL
jgi:nucleoid-associated protein YgaU